MKIFFGTHLDGVGWSSKSSAIGEVRTGPLGLLSILESRLCVSKPQVHPVHRINEYMNRMKSQDNGLTWYSKSFAVDPWSTARQFLEWRDELVEAGWQDKMPLKGSPRLEAIAAIENSDLPLSQGRSDRLGDVIRLLQKNEPIDISSIQLVEPLDMLPPSWQKIMKLLEAKGTVITYPEEANSIVTGSNLSHIKAIENEVDTTSSLSLTDDSLILLKSDDEWEAAEHLALWLASESEKNDQITIICGMDTGILDQALARHGLPQLGRSENSRWREIQQILPLILANAWVPVDIRLLAELLSLTSAPFPWYVRKYLLKAIAEEPGVGGKAWNDALSKISEKRKEELTEKNSSDVDGKTELFIKELQAILVDDRFEPDAGIPEGKLRERCQIVIEWLGWQIDTAPAFVEVISQAREIQKLSIGKGSVPKITLDRILDTVIGAGSVAEDRFEQTSSWNVVNHPGQIVDTFGYVIWWGFNDLAASTPAFWSKSERNALKTDEIFLEEPWAVSRREAYAWRHSLLHADKHFIAYYIAQIDGEESYHHPFWDTLWCAASQSGSSVTDDFLKSCLVRECRRYDHAKEWEFAGRRNTLEAVPHEIFRPVTPAYTVPPSVITGPEKLSYSQMSTLLGCPMKWALEYHAGLRLPENQVIPTGNQMIGTFCHRIIEEIYANGKQIGQAEAEKTTELLFDQLLPSMASELLLDGNAIERQRYRISITEAVGQLVEAVNRLKLTVELTEAPLAAAVNQVPFEGYADLLLKDGAGNLYVLDLKWSSSSKYRQQEVEEGSALQLASYAWMLRCADRVPEIHTGYFMLAQGTMISDSPMLSKQPVISPYTLEETWDMGVSGLNDVLQQLRKGFVEARGIAECIKACEDNADEKTTAAKIAEERRVQGMLYQKPPCHFCDFTSLCGLSGGVV